MPNRLGEMLVANGVLDPAGLERALAHQATSGLRLASCCLELGLADEEILAQTLSRQTGQPFVVLSQSAIPAATLAHLPAGLARALPALPLAERDQTLLVATPTPADIAVVGELVLATGQSPAVYGALVGPLAATIQAAYDQPEAEWVGSSAQAGSPAHLVHACAPGFDQDPGMEEAEEDPFSSGVDPLPSCDEEETSLMVVEDDPAIRKMLVTFLDRMGYGVVEAADGRTALLKLQTHLPHAFLLDAMLPGVHGFELCRMLKQAQATRDLPVIMVSAIYRGKDIREQARLEYGANAYLEKPLKLAELRRVLANCLVDRPAPPRPEALAKQLGEHLSKAALAIAAGQDAPAARALADAVAVAPFVPSLRYRLARLQLKLGQAFRAVDHLEWAARMAPTPAALGLLAQTQERTGFIQKATESWRACAGVCTDPAERDRALARVAVLEKMREGEE